MSRKTDIQIALQYFYRYLHFVICRNVIKTVMNEIKRKKGITITGKNFHLLLTFVCLFEYRQPTQQNNPKNNQTVEIEYLINSSLSSQLSISDARLRICHEVADIFGHDPSNLTQNKSLLI